MVNDKNHLYSKDDYQKDLKDINKIKASQGFSRFSLAAATSLNDAGNTQAPEALQIATRESWFRPINDTFGSVGLQTVDVFFGTKATGGRSAVTYNIYTVTDDITFAFSGTPMDKMLPFTLDLTINKTAPEPVITWPASLVNPPNLTGLLTDTARIILHFETIQDGVSERQIFIGGNSNFGGGGGSQTPWLSNIDANNFALLQARFADVTTPTKRVAIDVSGASVSTTTTLTFAQTLNSVITFPSISAGTISYLERTQTWTGINVFQADNTNAGLNVSLKVDPDPTSGGNGDIYYNITNNKFRGFENGAWVDVIGGGEVFTWTADHDANGNALIEFRHADRTDPTKQVKILNSGASPSTNTSLVFAQTLNSTLTFPSISAGTIPYLERTQTWTGHNVYTADASDSGFQVASKADPEPTGANGQIYFNTTDNKLRAYQQGVWFDVLGGVGNEVFTWSQNHDANGFALEAPRFADPTVTTKNVAFDISGASASTTTTLTFLQTLNSVITFPSISAGTISYLERTQTWTGINVFQADNTNAGLNVSLKIDPDPTSGGSGDIYYNITNSKFRGFEAGAWVDIIPTTFSDSVFRIVDNIDDTRKLAFQTGGISTSTTRTLTAPNHDGTIITDTNAQTITGVKTFQGTGGQIAITGTGAYIQMNSHPMEFQDMAEADVGSVGTGERRLFANEDNGNKLSVKTDYGVNELEFIEVEGHKHGSISTDTLNGYQLIQDTISCVNNELLVGDRMYAMPYIPQEDCQLVEVGIRLDSGNLATAGAGSVIGIYTNSKSADDGNYPLTKLGQTSEIDMTGVDTTREATLQSPVNLKGGEVYWLIFHQENVATEPDVVGYNAASMLVNIVPFAPSEFETLRFVGWFVSATYSTTMATSFPASATKMDETEDPPAIWVRCVLP